VSVAITPVPPYAELLALDPETLVIALLNHRVEITSAATGTLLKFYKQLKNNNILTSTRLKAVFGGTWDAIQGCENKPTRKAQEHVVASWGEDYHKLYGNPYELIWAKLQHANTLVRGSHTVFSMLGLLGGTQRPWQMRNLKGFTVEQ